MKSGIRAFKGYAKDLSKRNVSRLRRPVKIVRNRQEFQQRRELATIAHGQSVFDLSKLSEAGFLEIELDGEVLESLLAASRKKLVEADTSKARGTKAFFSQLLSDEDLGIGDIFVRVALQEKILNTIAGYLNCAPFLESVELLYSKPLEQKLMQSQLWHLDRTDSAIIKLFIYINDVEEVNGPFTLLSKALSSRVPDYLSHYLPDERIGKYVDLSQVITILGRAGSSFLVDTTNCYHLGSRCKAPRLAYIAYFSSGFGFFPRQKAWQVDDTTISALTPIQRMALGVEPRSNSSVMHH